MLANHISNNRFISRIYKELSKLNSKKEIQLIKDMRRIYRQQISDVQHY